MDVRANNSTDFDESIYLSLGIGSFINYSTFRCGLTDIYVAYTGCCNRIVSTLVTFALEAIRRLLN